VAMPSSKSDKTTDPKTPEKSQAAAVKPAENAQVAAKPVGNTGKKPLGVKEVIPFEWKLVGSSGGLVLTLFKAIERDDVEAQRERVEREGFYQDLRVLPANEPLKQVKAIKAAKDKAAKSLGAAPAMKKVAKAADSKARKKAESVMIRLPKPKAKPEAEKKTAKKKAKKKTAAKTAKTKKAAKKVVKKVTKKAAKKATKKVVKAKAAKKPAKKATAKSPKKTAKAKTAKKSAKKKSKKK